MREKPLLNEMELARRFWAARREHRSKRNTGPAHAEAVAFARRHNQDWVASLLEASRLEKAGDAETALGLLDRCGASIPERARGLLYFLRGTALATEGEIDEAIVAYRKALDSPGFDTPGYAWNNLGKALRSKGEMDEAIAAFRNALDSPGFDTQGDPWLGLGLTLWEKGEIDEAIAAYRKALDSPGFDTPGYAWNNLGLALLDKGEIDEAIDAFRKALDTLGYDSPGKAWNNLAIALQAKGEMTAARDAFEKALASTEEGDPVRAAARVGLRTLESRMSPEELTPDDRALLEKPAGETGVESIEERLIEKIRLAGETQYDRYLERSDSGRGDTLSILRGWSSSVTRLEGSERRWRGGGYFLKWAGFGVVLDPGIDFLRNFHDAGFHGREISAVIVSHDHPDHNEDLKPIDDLRYELYTRLKGKAGVEFTPYLLP